MKSFLIQRGVVILLAVTTIGTGTMYVVERQQGQQKTNDVATIQSSMLANQVTIAQLRNEIANASKLDSSFRTIPNAPQQPDLLRELQGAATSTSVSIQSAVFPPLASSTEKRTQSDSAVAMTLQATGSRDALLNFVHQLQTATRPVVVQSVQVLTGADASHAQLVLQLSFPFQGRG